MAKPIAGIGAIVRQVGKVPTYLDRPFDVRDSPLPWQRMGLQQTASGYGGKLTTSRMIRIRGESRWRRVYVMQWSNAGTAYVIIRGERYIVRSCDFPVGG